MDHIFVCVYRTWNAKSIYYDIEGNRVLVKREVSIDRLKDNFMVGGNCSFTQCMEKSIIKSSFINKLKNQ